MADDGGLLRLDLKDLRAMLQHVGENARQYTTEYGNVSTASDTVLGQLGNRVQHALRAFTPRDQNAVKTAAQTLRQNPTFDIEQAITELAVGEALVSTLDVKGSPHVTERAWMAPPCSQIGPIADGERDRIRKAGQSLYGHDEQTVDGESAYEKLKTRTLSKPARTAAAPPAAEGQVHYPAFVLRTRVHDLPIEAGGAARGVQRCHDEDLPDMRKSWYEHVKRDRGRQSWNRIAQSGTVVLRAKRKTLHVAGAVDFRVKPMVSVPPA